MSPVPEISPPTDSKIPQYVHARALRYLHPRAVRGGHDGLANVAKFDYSGNLTWVRNVYGYRPTGLAYDPTNDIVLVPTEVTVSGSTRRRELIALDSDGAISWESTLGSSANDDFPRWYQADGNGNFIAIYPYSTTHANSRKVYKWVSNTGSVTNIFTDSVVSYSQMFVTCANSSYIGVKHSSSTAMLFDHSGSQIVGGDEEYLSDASFSTGRMDGLIDGRLYSRRLNVYNIYDCVTNGDYDTQENYYEVYYSGFPSTLDVARFMTDSTTAIIVGSRTMRNQYDHSTASPTPDAYHVLKDSVSDAGAVASPDYTLVIPGYSSSAFVVPWARIGGGYLVVFDRGSGFLERYQVSIIDITDLSVAATATPKPDNFLVGSVNQPVYGVACASDGFYVAFEPIFINQSYRDSGDYLEFTK